MGIRFITLVLVLCSIVFSASAQKAATVKSFTQTTDHIPGNDRRNDLNGVPCALVKVQVVDEIKRIEGNKIGNIINHGVEKWVYMCKGSRNMRIHLSNHLPVKVMFQDYDINGLESNRVYELVIEIPDAPTPQQYPSSNVKQKLIINYSPKKAMVLVDSKYCKGNGKIELELPIGDHSYVIAAEGYITAEGLVKLNSRAPREITENLVAEKNALPEKNNDDNPDMSDILPSRNDKKSGKKKPEKGPELAAINKDKDEEIVYNEPSTFQSAPVVMMTPPKPLNKSFKYKYEGVTFKCKAKNGYVTITEFDVNAENVIIPGKVEFEGDLYPVREINTFINGNNYGAKRLVIQEGVTDIANYAFVEFRKLIDVTIPNSISKIGRNAFRDNKGLRFILPARINENDLRKGKIIRRK